MRIAVIMDPIWHIKPHKDTTFAMLLEAQARGFSIWYLTAEQLFMSDGLVRCTAQPIQVNETTQTYFNLGTSQPFVLSDFDLVLMRKDPPFDMNYIYATYLLESAQSAGLFVVNNPKSLRDCNEKLFATQFPQFMPPTLVTSQAHLIHDFHQQHQDIICKPLDGMGGASIFRIGADGLNLNVVIDTLTHQQRQPCMIQKYLPQIAQGDKRILMINGNPIPYVLARIPCSGDIRGNLAAGGRGEVRALTSEEKNIATAIGSELVQRGLFFVGLDMIGLKITEINVTSPTCAREIQQQSGYPVMSVFFDALEKTKLAL